MSWLARSIANSLNFNEHDGDSSTKPESKQSGNSESDDDEVSSPTTPSRGVKEDLSELSKTRTREFWGVASFLAPPPQPEENPDSDLADLEQDPLLRVRDDFAEIGGKFRSGISRLSKESDDEREKHDGIGSLGDGAVGVTEEVVAFARDVAMHPETWLDFPLPRDDVDFDLSDAQQEHALAVERLAPRLAALRIELCPGYMTESCFWKIYFVLVHPRLVKNDAELLSTPQRMGKNEGDRGAVESRGGSNENLISRSSSAEGKGKRFWKKVKYQLVEYHALPGYLKDNEYILGHYRAEWPLKQALLSVFSIHNETLNVWTHLIGFFLFLSLTIYTAMKVPNVVDLPRLQNLPSVLRNADFQKLQAELITCLPSLPHMPDLQRLREELKTSLPSMDYLSNWHIMELLSNCLPENLTHSNHTDICVLRSMKEDVANIIAPLLVRPITRWPFFAFLGGAMFCLLASSTCHLLSCHSERVAYFMLRLDYAGIAALISTSFYPPVYYSFMCYPFFCNLYMGFITLLGIGTILASLLPVFQTPEYRTFRASLFFGMGFSGAAPILHKLILFWHQPEALHTTGYEVLMGVFYGIGALVYAMRIPERWMPGKFDIAGHSHQLFHVLVVAGAYTHYQAGLVYLRWRDLQGC